MHTSIFTCGRWGKRLISDQGSQSDNLKFCFDVEIESSFWKQPAYECKLNIYESVSALRVDGRPSNFRMVITQFRESASDIKEGIRSKIFMQMYIPPKQFKEFGELIENLGTLKRLTVETNHNLEGWKGERNLFCGKFSFDGVYSRDFIISA